MEFPNREVAIGEKIKEVFDKSELRIGDFAAQLGMVRQNVYRIFERTTIDTGLLMRISELLNHNFFQYYIAAESTQSSSASATTWNDFSLEEKYTVLAEELAKTKAELELANKEIMYLKKITDLMEERAKWLNSR